MVPVLRHPMRAVSHCQARRFVDQSRLEFWNYAVVVIEPVPQGKSSCDRKYHEESQSCSGFVIFGEAWDAHDAVETVAIINRVLRLGLAQSRESTDAQGRS
jgi:hypothetical protein